MRFGTGELAVLVIAAAAFAAFLVCMVGCILAPSESGKEAGLGFGFLAALFLALIMAGLSLSASRGHGFDYAVRHDLGRDGWQVVWTNRGDSEARVRLGNCELTFHIDDKEHGWVVVSQRGNRFQRISPVQAAAAARALGCRA